MSDRVKILLVDDRNENLVALESLLQDDQTEIYKARSGREALELLLVNKFALAMLDVQMPEINGFELAELMRGAELTRSIPIIFVTAGAIDANHTFKGYEAGAVDFLYKPLDPRVVRSKVRVFRELEQQRMTIQAQLTELSKALRARDEFLSIASHELKTPLASLQLQLQMSRRAVSPATGQVPPAEKLAKSLDASIRQIFRLNHLIEDLLDVTRIQAGRLTINLEDIDLTETVREVAERFHDQLTAAKTPLELDLDTPVRAHCDPFRAEQVVVNLVTNVLKYAAGTPLRIGVRQVDGWARITVHDSGTGIPPEKLSTIFDRFERAGTHPGVSGLGLGLYIVKQIMTAHGGQVHVQSEFGQGCVFHADFPLAATDRDASP